LLVHDGRQGLPILPQRPVLYPQPGHLLVCLGGPSLCLLPPLTRRLQVRTQPCDGGVRGVQLTRVLDQLLPLGGRSLPQTVFLVHQMRHLQRQLLRVGDGLRQLVGQQVVLTLQDL
jgi:hypothetical protein